MSAQDRSHHGIPEDAVADVIAKLGIKQHNPEDCRVSRALHSAIGREQGDTAVVAEGRTVYVLLDDGLPASLSRSAWMRYRLPAGARRRILAGHPGGITLEPWVS